MECCSHSRHGTWKRSNSVENSKLVVILQCKTRMEIPEERDEKGNAREEGIHLLSLLQKLFLLFHYFHTRRGCAGELSWSLFSLIRHQKRNRFFLLVSSLPLCLLRFLYSDVGVSPGLGEQGSSLIFRVQHNFSPPPRFFSWFCHDSCFGRRHSI